jgi:hypothetical protein
MEAQPTDHGPQLSALRTACTRLGLDDTGTRALHRHATAVYLLPQHDLVARVGRTSPVSVELTRWLNHHQFPAVEPADLEQPVLVGELAVTFWHHYPQPDSARPDAEALGALLRRLHELPLPPLPLPEYEPLSGLDEVLDLRRTIHGIDSSDLQWLADRRQQLLDSFHSTPSELGVGLIHGDAYPGNTMWSGPERGEVLLGDWDEAAIGPRELDLINSHQGARVGRTAAEIERFDRAYGWDITRWPGYALLRDIRDLHTLGAYFHRSFAGDQSAVAELSHRLRTLRAGDVEARWHTR